MNDLIVAILLLLLVSFNLAVLIAVGKKVKEYTKLLENPKVQEYEKKLANDRNH